MRAGRDTVHVTLDAPEFGAAQEVGQLHMEAARGAAVVAFEYNRIWLQTGRGFALDPDLALMPGRTYPPNERAHFGVFLDSAPDR